MMAKGLQTRISSKAALSLLCTDQVVQLSFEGTDTTFLLLVQLN